MSTWGTGLFAVCNDGALALDTLFCLPCQLGRQCSALDGITNAPNCMFCLVGMCTGPLMVPVIRKKLVDKYSIDEGICTTCCCGLLCHACSTCQAHRELTLRGTWPGGACCVSSPGNFQMQ